MIHEMSEYSQKPQFILGSVARKIDKKSYKSALPIPKAHEDEELRAIRRQKSYGFKKIEDIQKMLDYFISKKRYRDYALFIIGCNTGLRCGDLIRLKWEDFYYNDILRDSVEIIEQKTNKLRIIFISPIIEESLNLLRSKTPIPHGYIFRSQRAPHINVRGVNTMLKKAAKQCKILFRVGTHSMRRTFAYYWIRLHNNSQEALISLQYMLNHSSQSYTLIYSGMTDDIVSDWTDDISKFMTDNLNLVQAKN